MSGLCMKQHGAQFLQLKYRKENKILYLYLNVYGFGIILVGFGIILVDLLT